MNRGRGRGRGKARGGGGDERGRGRGRGRGGNISHEERGRRNSSSYMDHDKSDGNDSSLNDSGQGYNFMAELESYKAIKGQERRQQDTPSARGMRARSVSSERSVRSTSSYKSTNAKNRAPEGNRMGDTYPIEKWKQMVLKMALELNTSSEETNTDCYFFYYATCSKNTDCPFRHEPAAVNSRLTCQYWRQGKCHKQKCSYRHMEFETTQRAEAFCYFENQPGGCQKNNCTFKHKNDSYDQDGEYMNEEDERNFGDSSFNEENVLNTSTSTQQQCTKLFVGSKSFANITEDDLRETFSQFGKILHCNIPKLPDGNNRNFGFVEFANGDAAEKALKQTRKLFIKGNVLHVNKKTDKADGEKEKGTKLFVGAKSFANITEDDLSKCFSQFGRVNHCNIPKNPDGTNRNFGFVVLENEEAADKAIKQNRNLYIKGIVLTINKKTEDNKEETTKSNNSEVTKRVDNFLDMFRTTLTSPNKEGGMKDEYGNQHEEGEIVDNKENLSGSENNSKPIFGSKAYIEEENGFNEPLTPAIEAIRRRMMEGPGIEVKVEEFLAAVRISLAPPQQTGLRKSLADRLSFKNTNNQPPPSLSINEMKNRITSLKQSQQQNHQFADASGRFVYDPDFLYELQYCDLACVKPANLPKALTRKSLPKIMIQKQAAMANRGQGRGSGGPGNRGGGVGRGGAGVGLRDGPGMMQMESNIDEWDPEKEMQEQHEFNSALFSEPDIDESSMRGGIGGFRGAGRGRGYPSAADVPWGHGVGRGSDPLRPNESPGAARGRGRGYSTYAGVAQEYTNIEQQKHIESQPQSDKVSSATKLLGENKPTPATQIDQNRSLENPDTNLLDTKKPLLEMPQKAEDPKTDIFSMIHKARLGQPDTDKNLKSPNKPDTVVKKDDLLPKKLNEKPLSADAKPFDPRDPWHPRDRGDERPNWQQHPDDRWYDERRDPRYEGEGYEYDQRNSSFREYDREWDPRREPGRDWGYDRNYDREWEADRRADPNWNDERDPRYMYDRRERSPIRDRGILGPGPEDEGILGAPPKDSYDRFSDRYNDDREMRDWGQSERRRESLNDLRLRDQWDDGYSQQRDWDRYPDQRTRDRSPGRLPERDDIRNWGPEGISDPYRSAEREYPMDARRDYGNMSPGRRPDMRGTELPPRWSPGREDPLRTRPDERNIGMGSPGRRELSRGRSPLPSSEMRNYPLHPSPGRRETSRGRSPLPSSEMRNYPINPSPGRQETPRGRSPPPSSEIRNYPIHPSPSRRDSPRSRSPLPSTESRNYPLHPSPSRRDSSLGKSPLPSSENRNYPLQKTSPTAAPKMERSSSPNLSGRSQAVENSALGQQKNICVKNLPTWSDEQSLKNVLSFEYKKYGSISRVVVLGTATDKYAVVCFRKPQEAQEALRDSRNKQVFGQNVVVSIFDGELPAPEESKVFMPKTDQEYNQLLAGYKGEEYEALRSILEVHKKECRNYREQPSTHAQYSKEYHAFCIEKQNKILSIGGDPTKYDILPEWKAYWPRRLEELFVETWQNIKKKCLASLTAKKEVTPRKSSSSSSSKRSRRSPSPRSGSRRSPSPRSGSRRSPSPRSGSRRSPSPRSGSRRSPSPRSEKSRRKHKSSHSKSHSSSSRHRDKSRSRRRRSSSRSSTESSSTPRRDRHSERHSEKRKKSKKKRDRSSSRSSSSTERYESKKKSPKKKEKKEFPKEDPMEDGEIRDDDMEHNGSTQSNTKKENYQDFIKQRMSDVLGPVHESESTNLKDKSDSDKSKKKKSKFPNENYPYTTDGTPKVKKDFEGFESKSVTTVNKLVSYESEDDHNVHTARGGGGALGALMAQYSEQPTSASHSSPNSPLKICGNVIQIIDILSISDETISSVSQPLKDLYKKAMNRQSSGADPIEVFKDGKAAVNLTSCKLAILAESGTISKTNKKLYQEAQENIDKLMNLDQQYIEGINIDRMAKKTMDMNVSEAIQYIKIQLLNSNPAENVSEDRVMNLYMEIKKKQLMFLS